MAEIFEKEKIERLEFLRILFKNIRLMIERPLPSVYVVENAIPSFKKVYPSYRKTLVISSGVSFLFICFFLFLLDKIRTLLSQFHQ